jgi:hypothetical protein
MIVYAQMLYIGSLLPAADKLPRPHPNPADGW